MGQRPCELAHERLDASWFSPFQALTRSKVPAQISLVLNPLAAHPPACERRVSTWTLHGWTARAETSEREIYRRACCVRSSRLGSLPQASRSYAPFAPSCLHSLTPDAHRAGPLHPIAGEAEVSRCSSFPASLVTGLLMDLTRKRTSPSRGFVQVNGVACLKATGLTYCNVECKRTGL